MDSKPQPSMEIDLKSGPFSAVRSLKTGLEIASKRKVGDISDIELQFIQKLKSKLENRVNSSKYP